jgi:hypothetical protein
MKKLLIILAILSVLTMIACGGGGSSSSSAIPTAGPTPSGGFSNASVSGRYVYNLRGAAGASTFAALGAFTADGAGNLTSGTEDGFSSGTGNYSVTFTGTYTVSADGRGSANISYSGGQQLTMRFVLISGARARVIELSSQENANGTLERQDAATVGALNGTYVLRLDGNDSGFPFSTLGAVTSSGGASGTLTGTMDENDDGTVTNNMAVDGTYAIGAGGRGTASLNTPFGPANYIFYVISATKLQVLSTNSAPQVSGSGTQQVGAFSPASMNGNFVFVMAGNDNSGVVREARRFTLNGGGAVVGGTEDLLDAGSFAENLPFTGTYTAASNGRVQAQFTFNGSTLQILMWMTSPTTGFIFSSDPTSVESGYVSLQSTGFTNSTLSGNYAFEMSGSSGGSTDVVAQFKSDGAGTITGNQDYSSAGTLVTGASFPGSYAMASTGRATGTFGSTLMRVYMVDTNTFYTVSADAVNRFVGIGEKQQ